MAVTVQEISVNGPKLTVERGGYSRIRAYSVQGLDQTKDVFYQALTAVDASSGVRVPQYGQPDPRFPGAYVTKVDFDHYPTGSRTGVIVHVLSTHPEAGGSSSGLAIKCRITGSNSQFVVKRWPPGPAGGLGDPIIIGYSPNNLTKFPDRIDPKDAGNSKKNEKEERVFDLAEIPILSPGTVLEFERLEPTSSLKNSVQYRRTVNKTPWQGQPPGTWFCRNVDCESQAGLKRWMVKYTFELDPLAQWNKRLEVFKDRDTGRVPTDIGANIAAGNNNGYVLYSPYLEQDFNGLKLPNI